METPASGGDEFLVLTDELGNYYAIPRERVESYRVSDAERERLEQALDGDVSGFSMYHQYVNEHRAAQYQAERRQEAAAYRLAKGAGSDDAEEAQPDAAPAAGMGQVLTGIWRRLPFLRRAEATP